MYRVVIVDDEEPVLDSFSFILERERDEFSLCGKARSGTEAIRVIGEVRPDIVFMDVQMPGIDGIEVIAQVRQQNPDTVFILATAYERFDIAQRAIPLGVFSYLVKPISRKMMVGELYRVRDFLELSRERRFREEQQGQWLERSKEDLKDRLFAGLAWESPTAADWEHFSRLYALKTERNAICIVEARKDLSPEARELLFGKLTERIQFKVNCVHSRVNGRLVLLLPEDPGADSVAACLGPAVGESLADGLSIGSGSARPFSELTTSYREAHRSLAGSKGGFAEDRSDSDEMRRICGALLGTDFEEGLRLFEAFQLRAFRDQTFEVAKGKMVAFFTLLVREIEDRTPSASIELNPAEAIMSIRSTDEWRRWSTQTLQSVKSLLSKREPGPLSYHLAKAISIIQEKFDQPIQLSSVAEECRITTNYLCRLFSEQLGVSFVDYLTRYRIERAMSLMRQSVHSIKEVSGLVGFQDPNYFSRVFRRHMGVSPSDLLNRNAPDEN